MVQLLHVTLHVNRDGSLLLAVVILYGFTKDRWRWRRLIAQTVICVAALSVVIGLGFGAVYFWSELPAPVRLQIGYAGLSRGMTPDEVMYVKGYPPTVLGKEVEDSMWKGSFQVIETKNLEKGKTVKDYLNWSYGDNQENINVEFDDRQKVAVIQCYSAEKSGRCPPIEGITDGATEEEVVHKLSLPSASRFEGVTKSIQYSGRGIRLILEKERVYMLEVKQMP
jgi:hypothetical protein